ATDAATRARDVWVPAAAAEEARDPEPEPWPQPGSEPAPEAPPEPQAEPKRRFRLLRASAPSEDGRPDPEAAPTEPGAAAEPEAETELPDLATEAEAVEPVPVPEGAVSLATAHFEDLRDLGMSVTQAKRIVRYRDERGLTDPDELDQVPGFPKDVLAALKAK